MSYIKCYRSCGVISHIVQLSHHIPKKGFGVQDQLANFSPNIATGSFGSSLIVQETVKCIGRVTILVQLFQQPLVKLG